MNCALFAVTGFLLLACNPVQKSHIAANVPAASTLDQYLQRDLKKYFSGADITFELLRREPTQSGVGYPKFYAWVRAVAPGARPVEGAVRLEAVEHEQFIVTDFLPTHEIRADPSQVDAIFPAALCAGIKHRAGVPGA
jgi:hypothetical protein